MTRSLLSPVHCLLWCGPQVVESLELLHVLAWTRVNETPLVKRSCLRILWRRHLHFEQRRRPLGAIQPLCHWAKDLSTLAHYLHDELPLWICHEKLELTWERPATRMNHKGQKHGVSCLCSMWTRSDQPMEDHVDCRIFVGILAEVHHFVSWDWWFRVHHFP